MGRRLDPEVLTIGTFDRLHKGHLDLINAAADLGRLGVGVNSDRFAASYKRPPGDSQTARMDLVEALPRVERVYLNDGPGAELIREIRPKYLVIGNDWLENEYLAQVGVSHDDLNYLGVSIVYIPRVRDISTSKILNV